jgi:hypothetical protein
MLVKKTVWLTLAVVALLAITASQAIAADQKPMSEADQKQFNIQTSALNWAVKHLGLCSITRVGLLIKGVLEKLVDNVFKMLCESLVKLWDFTKPLGQTGVGETASNYVNGTVMPVLYTIVGAFLYLFVVLKLFTSLLMNENPSKMVGYFVIVVFFIITFTLFYRVTIELFSHTLNYMKLADVKIGTAELSRDFAKGLIDNNEMVDKISDAAITDDEIVEMYTSGKGPDIWLVILSEILTTSMFVFFVVQILLLKGQQLVQLFLSYFLGILILPITILSGVDLFVRWIKSFVGTCLYSVSWALIIMLLYVVANIELGGLQKEGMTAMLPSILKLMMFYGAFMLMTQVGKVSEFFTGGDTFGKIAQSSSREFSSCLRTAGQVAAMPITAPLAGVAAGATMMGFGAGLVGGFTGKNTKTPSAGSFGGGSGGGKGGGAGFMSLPGVSNFMNAQSSGQAFGSQARGAVDLGAKSLSAIRNFAKSDYGGNDGTKAPEVKSFSGEA